MSSPSLRPSPHDPRAYAPPPSSAPAPVGEGLTLSASVRFRDLSRARQLVIGFLTCGMFVGGRVTSRAAAAPGDAAREAQQDSTVRILARALEKLQEGRETDRAVMRGLLWWVTGEARAKCLDDPAEARRRALPCTGLLEGRPLPLDQMGRLLAPDRPAPVPPTFVTREAP